MYFPSKRKSGEYLPNSTLLSWNFSAFTGSLGAFQLFKWPPALQQQHVEGLFLRMSGCYVLVCGAISFVRLFGLDSQSFGYTWKGSLADKRIFPRCSAWLPLNGPSARELNGISIQPGQSKITKERLIKEKENSTTI